MKRSKILITFIITATCFLSVQTTKTFILPKIKVSLDKRTLHRSKGDPSYPLWVVEYLDFQCGSCRFASQKIKEYLVQHPSKVFLQVRFFPIEGHPHGVRSAVYGECAAEQNRFWDFYDIVFEKQPEWTQLKSIDTVFLGYTQVLRMDTKQLEACVDNPKTERTVTEEKQKAKSLGINVTPSFFIRGRLVTGIENALNELEKELKK